MEIESEPMMQANVMNGQRPCRVTD